MTDDDRAKFQRGADLLKEVQSGKLFDDYWVPIGEGLVAVRRTVMTALRLKKASGGYYNHAFGRLCHETAYADLQKVERANLLYCMEHSVDITEMRVGWTLSERASINHPTTMAKRLRDFLKRPIGEEPTEPRRNTSPMRLLKHKNEELTRANLDLAERLAATEQRDGSLFDLSLDTPEDIAQVIIGNVSLNKAKTIHQALGRALAADRPAG
jgi:hypothetical protein